MGIGMWHPVCRASTPDKGKGTGWIWVGVAIAPGWHLWRANQHSTQHTPCANLELAIATPLWRASSTPVAADHTHTHTGIGHS